MSDDAETRDPGFDAASAMRLAFEVQRLGLTTADAVVDQFARLIDRFGVDGVDGASASGGSGNATGRVGVSAQNGKYQRLQADVERALDGYLGLLRQLHEAALPVIGRLGPNSTEQTDRLELAPIRAGSRSSSRVWVHNQTSSAVHQLRPWTPGLHSHTGAVVTSDCVRFDPSTIDHLPAGESAAILVMIDVAPELRTGTYHGLLLVEHLPDQSMPVSVSILAPDGVRR